MAVPITHISSDSFCGSALEACYSLSALLLATSVQITRGRISRRSLEHSSSVPFHCLSGLYSRFVWLYVIEKTTINQAICWLQMADDMEKDSSDGIIACIQNWFKLKLILPLVLLFVLQYVEIPSLAAGS